MYILLLLQIDHFCTGRTRFDRQMGPTHNIKPILLEAVFVMAFLLELFVLGSRWASTTKTWRKNSNAVSELTDALP